MQAKRPLRKVYVKKNYFYEKMKALNIQMKNAELRRLTYVAVTRAVNELYITNGKYSQNINAATSYCPGSEKSLDTIYNTLAPSINYFENADDDPDSQPAQVPPAIKYFDTEDIPVYDDVNSEAYTVSLNSQQNTLSAKLNFISLLEKSGAYEKAEIIIPEVVPKKHASPSQLHKIDDESGFFERQTASHAVNSTSADDSSTGDTPSPLEAYAAKPSTPYPEINDIVIASIPKKDGQPDPQAEPRFGFSNFGTIAHAYMEAVVTGEPAVYSNRDIVGLENNAKNLATIISICEEMQQKLRDSELGKAAINATWHKAEYPFRSRIGSKIIKGIIDLVFKNADGTYTIVDYKTNQTIAPDLYYNQLACYRHATAAMLNVPASEIKCVLYYLRFGKAVDITTECSAVDLEKVVEDL